MIYIQNDNKDAAFHFSVEELFTRYLRIDEPVLMIWQTGKTVMLGNNQIASAEVDINLANISDIPVIRRSSGGGAIYTDPGTVLYTMIEPVTKEPQIHREELSLKIIGSLAVMGVSAVREGRNDILIEGKKISGFAQYTSGKHICTHGSLLFDTDLDMLAGILLPQPEKLLPKGIASIRSRVTNIRPYLQNDCSVDEFVVMLKNEFIIDNNFSFYKLNNDDIKRINEIGLEKYSNNAWNFRM